MILQLLIFILLIFGVSYYSQNSINDRDNDKSHKSFIIYAMVLFILQSGLRNVAVGTDTYAYYLDFESVYYLSWDSVLDPFFIFITTGSGKDPGYLILVKLFVSIIPSYRAFLLLVAISFFFSLGRILYKYTKSNYEVLVALALYQCMYYSFFSITGIRQTIATSILLFAVPYAIDKKKWKFILLVFLAATQHKSALLFLPFYFLGYIKNTKRVMLLAFVSFIPMLLFGGAIAKYLTSGTVFEQYAGYLEGSEKAGAYTFAVYMILLCVFTVVKMKTINSESLSNYIFVSAVAVALALTPLTAIDPNNMRIVQYYSIFGLLILPKICGAYSQSTKDRNLYIVLFVFFGIYTLVRNNDYAFFWQEMQLPEVYNASGTITDSDLLL